MMGNIKTLSLDLETYSSYDLKKCGVYKYSESPDFEIILFAYSVNEGPVEVVDIACGEHIPDSILSALLDSSVEKWAYNAQFERVCLSNWLRQNAPQYSVPGYLDPTSWKCSWVWGAYLGLPLSLGEIGAALKLDDQKMEEGKDLIKYFCKPCRPTIKNGQRTRNYPHHAPDWWIVFKEYNKRDVEVELAIKSRMAHFPVPDFVWDEYHLDQEINDRGIRVDLQFAEHAIDMDNSAKSYLRELLYQMTGLRNAYSPPLMKLWLADRGILTDSLDKDAVKKLMRTVDAETAVVLKRRQQLGKSSVSKYKAMQQSVCADGRAHGMFMFYGANRTGRWAGRIIQLQNLPQNHIGDLAEARGVVQSGDFELMSMLYEDVPSVLSELIRTAFVPAPGYKFIVSDFSAIEARVLSYLSGETWRTDVFRNGGDIYCASASKMFHVPVEKHGTNGHLRQKGKIAELALGYGGSVGALTAMGALDMGLQQNELRPLVTMWRDSNPHIVDYWWDVDRAITQTVAEHITTAVGCVRFSWKSGMLFITLPSGRQLAYAKPRIGLNRFGGESVTYMGIDTTKKWSRIESYGPKFVENIVQAISRDILAYAMRSLSEYRIVGHVHDELIIETPTETSVDAICDQMGQTPPWLPGLCLRADGYECEFYMKD